MDIQITWFLTQITFSCIRMNTYQQIQNLLKIDIEHNIVLSHTGIVHSSYKKNKILVIFQTNIWSRMQTKQLTHILQTLDLFFSKYSTKYEVLYILLVQFCVGRIFDSTSSLSSSLHYRQQPKSDLATKSIQTFLNQKPKNGNVIRGWPNISPSTMEPQP